ncbi:MAG: FG-GAP-like repeat-containing protein [Dehalococcoidia bacterium]
MRPFKRAFILIALIGIVLFSLPHVVAGQALGSVTFTPATGSPFAAGTNPVSIATADFDNNGKPDLVVANAGSNNISILLGNGDGTFQTPANFPAGTAPSFVAVAKLRGDSSPFDVVTVNTGSNTVTVLLGNGDGSFQPFKSYAAGTSPRAVAIGRFRTIPSSCQGASLCPLDIAVTNDPRFTSAGSLSLLQGNGDGTFKAPNSIATGVNLPEPLVAADLNGDGKLDLIDGEAASLVVRLGNGDGTFQSPVVVDGNAHPQSIVVTDLNADTKPDVVIINDATSTFDVFLGNGSGGFLPRVDYGTSNYPNSLTVADFDGDGKLDIAVALGNQSAGVMVLLGNGDGTLQPALTVASGGGGFGSIVAADFNGDQRRDLAAVAFSNVAVGIGAAVLLNTPPPPPKPDAAMSTVVATPTSVSADNTSTSKITVTLKDVNGNRIGGKTVSLHAGSGQSTISTASGMSSGLGVVTFTVKDATVESVTYTATDMTDNVPITQTATVSFIALPPPEPGTPTPCRAGFTACISPSIIPIAPGGFGYGSLQLSIPTGANVASWLITVSFDPTKFQVVGCTPIRGSCDSTSAGNQFSLSGSANPPLTGTVPLAQFTVRSLSGGSAASAQRVVPADEFEYDFSVTVVRLTDGSGNPVPGGGDNGRVIVTAKGDVNGDGRMDAVDALCVLRTVAGFSGTATCPPITTTLPSPGHASSENLPVNAVDALCILRSVALLPGTTACPLIPPLH